MASFWINDSTLSKLFEGQQSNTIECLDVDYRSENEEQLSEIQLDVKGCTDVYASFGKYVEPERLEGEDKIKTEQHGLQKAQRTVSFIKFPPVLILQLKRFQYDCATHTLSKINDYYEFPPQLDLDREDKKYLSSQADGRIQNLHSLHSVIVHSGGTKSGHYYAFIRPTLTDSWYKFNDDKVTKAYTHNAINEQYGGEETDTGAYVLVYIREGDKRRIFCSVDESLFRTHLMERMKKREETGKLVQTRSVCFNCSCTMM